jgi:hypothetical protein
MAENMKIGLDHVYASFSEPFTSENKWKTFNEWLLGRQENLFGEMFLRMQKTLGPWEELEDRWVRRDVACKVVVHAMSDLIDLEKSAIDAILLSDGYFLL